MNEVDAVVREDHMRFNISSRGSGTLFVRSVVTILNEKGNHYAKRIIGYNKLMKVLNVTGVVYDQLGNQVRHLKPGEIYDQSSYDGLFSDNRIKAIDLSQATYPYTVEIQYELEFKFLYYIPGTMIGGERVSVQNASYTLIYPPSLKPRYRSSHVDEKPVVSKVNATTESLTWYFANVMPLTVEPSGPHEDELVPSIEAAPSQFEYDGHPGSMNSWQEYGSWNAALNRDRNALPQPTRDKVHQLTQGLTSDEQKARVLYEYMQNKTRYVSIQLGIGGLQTFPATVVDETGYGDCKALSNYMVALLKEAGIKGYYVVIKSGPNQRQFYPDFPSHQFDHVIVAVPNKKDTIWLECTSQTQPFGFLGSFTDDRSALLITDDGGKLVKTPTYAPEQNRQTRTLKATIDATGAAKVLGRTTYTGLQIENGNLFELVGNASDEQKKWVQNSIPLPTFNINSYSIKGRKDKIPYAVVNLDLTLARYASLSGKRMFLTPNMLNRNTYIPAKVESRKTDVVRNSSYLDVDTVIYQFPENLYPEFLPPPVKLTSRFGEYEADYKIKEGELIYIRRMKMWRGRYPKESYNELQEFFKGVNKSDNAKIVFLSKT
jgi:transglutaminase-like putative cysteine protease